MASDGDLDRAPEQSGHIKIDGIKTRMDRPLQLEKIGSSCAVEGAFVSRLQVGSLFCCGKRKVRRIAEFADGVADARQVSRMDQQIDISGLPQGDVSIDQFRQRQAFVGHDFDAECRQVLNDSNQLA